MAFSLTQMRSYCRALLLNSTTSFARVSRYVREAIMFLHRFFASHMGPFWIQLCYFVSLSLLGSLALMILKPSNSSFSPRYVDMLFMSTSALTVSGLVTVQMEDLSSSQIVVLTLLMFLGGEVFVSLLCLLLRRAEHSKPEISDNRVDSGGTELDSMEPSGVIDQIELGLTVVAPEKSLIDGKDLRHSCVRYLGFVVLGYILLIHMSGTVVILLYIILDSSARDVLKRKGIHVFLFSLSTTVSSFANGGLIATNENMAIFKENAGLLLLIVPQVLAGNTLFPLFLRMVIWALSGLTKAEEFKYMMKSPREIRFGHLLPNLQTFLLSLTVISFIAAQLVLFCSMDWSLEVFGGLNSYRKIVSALFMAVNARHAGENSIDLSLASPAVLVLFMVMMNLPASSSFAVPFEDDTSSAGNRTEIKRSRSLIQDLILPQLYCIVVCIISICIAERRELSRDPLNFSTLNVVFEVVSGYGNVGFSIGYSCSRLLELHPDASCEDKAYSFSGWWSDQGKLILAFVMLYGRLKKFSMRSGRAWKLSKASGL